MKIFIKILAALAILSLLDSCAFLFNGKNVEVAINSNPQGADVIIEGRSYGRTPAVINIEPKNYIATLTKEGYGSTQIKLETWQAVRSSKNGDGGRCVADAVGSLLVLPAFSFMSVYCRDFKQSEYFAEIPRSASAGGNREGGSGDDMLLLQQRSAPYGYTVPSQQQNNNPYRGY